MPPEAQQRNFIRKILELIRARAPVGGLEISDTALRFASQERGSWKLTAVRLPPGVIQGGAVRSFPEFVQALQSLHEQIVGRKSSVRLGVVVSLSSVNVYSQVFLLPLISGESFETAVRLNMEMISPADISQFYAGWQILNEGEEGSSNLEILGAFISRSVIDDMKRALSEARFLPLAVESKALALTRLMRTWGAGFDRKRSYVVLLLDPVGIDFLVVRNGQLYFEYLTFWKDIQGNERALAPSVFQASLIQNLRQVLNFYSQHWSEPLAELLIAAPDLKEHVAKVIKENFSLTIRELSLQGSGAVPPAWFVALGSGLRGAMPRREDREISLSGIGAQEEFAREELRQFLRFWRFLVPLALSILLVAFVVADLFLARFSSMLRVELQDRPGVHEVAELKMFEQRVTDFNKSVALIIGIQESLRPKNEIISKIQDVAQDAGVTIDRLSLSSGGNGFGFGGRAPSESHISTFKQKMETFQVASSAAPFFSNVQVPLANIKRETQDVSFWISFSIPSFMPGNAP